MLMTGYAFNNKEKRTLVLRDPESPGQVRSVRKIRILREKVRTLRASAQQQKNRLHTDFQSSINCPWKIKSRENHHKHITKFLKLT
jgi:hypothetical protein